jgi:hypothetical protein
MINQERAAEHIPLKAALHANEAGAILAAFSRLILHHMR